MGFNGICRFLICRASVSYAIIKGPWFVHALLPLARSFFSFWNTLTTGVKFFFIVLCQSKAFFQLHNSTCLYVIERGQCCIANKLIGVCVCVCGYQWVTTHKREKVLSTQVYDSVILAAWPIVSAEGWPSTAWVWDSLCSPDLALGALVPLPAVPLLKNWRSLPKILLNGPPLWRFLLDSCWPVITLLPRISLTFLSSVMMTIYLAGHWLSFHQQVRLHRLCEEGQMDARYQTFCFDFKG